jgi:hypothetical protein
MHLDLQIDAQRPECADHHVGADAARGRHVAHRVVQLHIGRVVERRHPVLGFRRFGQAYAEIPTVRAGARLAPHLRQRRTCCAERAREKQEKTTIHAGKDSRQIRRARGAGAASFLFLHPFSTCAATAS